MQFKLKIRFPVFWVGIGTIGWVWWFSLVLGSMGPLWWVVVGQKPCYNGVGGIVPKSGVLGGGHQIGGKSDEAGEGSQNRLCLCSRGS